jgi:hypothetical protein
MDAEKILEVFDGEILMFFCLKQKNQKFKTESLCKNSNFLKEPKLSED